MPESECGMHVGVERFTVFVAGRGGGRPARFCETKKKKVRANWKKWSSLQTHYAQGAPVVAPWADVRRGRGFWRVKGASEKCVESVNMKRFRIKYVSGT